MLVRVAARRSLSRCNSSLGSAARRIALPQQPSRPLSVAAAHAQAGRRDPVAAALAKHWPVAAAAAAAVAGEPAAGAGADGGAD